MTGIYNLFYFIHKNLIRYIYIYRHSLFNFLFQIHVLRSSCLAFYPLKNSLAESFNAHRYSQISSYQIVTSTLWKIINAISELKGRKNCTYTYIYITSSRVSCKFDTPQLDSMTVSEDIS